MLISNIYLKEQVSKETGKTLGFFTHLFLFIQDLIQ